MNEAFGDELLGPVGKRGVGTLRGAAFRGLRGLASDLQLLVKSSRCAKLRRKTLPLLHIIISFKAYKFRFNFI